MAEIGKLLDPGTITVHKIQQSDELGIAAAADEQRFGDLPYMKTENVL